MAYTITKANGGLKIVDTGGKVTYLPKPVLTSFPVGIYPNPANSIEARSESEIIVMKLSDIATIDGAATAGTLDAAFDQMATLL